MSKTINIGIDLGTTNSSIAVFEEGEVRIFKNPRTLKETTASVVAYKNGRVIVGEKAKELLNKKSESVFGGFKRKMGTKQIYKVPDSETETNPVELSSVILKELRNFIPSDTSTSAAVITIPAAFDTIQSNATKKAGYAAGIEEVVLLQEPIAASLAYANKSNFDIKAGQWLVYDLGGGTFDVALVEIVDDELKIIDHEGDNFLGGLDFDKAVIREFIIPETMKLGHFQDLEGDLFNTAGKRNALYYRLLYIAEEVKKILSTADEAEIEFDIEDDNGESLEIILSLDKNRFNQIIYPIIDRSINYVSQVVERNKLDLRQLECILLIGGSTYIPLVRNRLEEFSSKVLFGIDPTTAVAVGAAYYAGMKSRRKQVVSPSMAAVSDSFVPKCTLSYEKFSRETKAVFVAQSQELNVQYRITRSDGGYDSGLISICLLYTSPSPRDATLSRMPSSA